MYVVEVPVNLTQLTRSIALHASLTLITACGGGGGGSSGNAAAQGSNTDSGCIGFCATSSPANLTVANVQQVIAQAVQEAQARGILPLQGPHPCARTGLSPAHHHSATPSDRGSPGL